MIWYSKTNGKQRIIPHKSNKKWNASKMGLSGFVRPLGAPKISLILGLSGFILR